MVDNNYKNAFKEVYEILSNTDQTLIEKIPKSFLNFIKDNMNIDYITNIQKDIDIDKQPLLQETEAVLALIYRSYWNDGDIDNDKSSNSKYKSIDEIFSNKDKIDNLVLTKDLVVIEKKNFLKRFFESVLKMIRKQK